MEKLRNTAFTTSGFCSNQQGLSADDLPRACSTKPMQDLLSLHFAVSVFHHFNLMIIRVNLKKGIKHGSNSLARFIPKLVSQPRSEDTEWDLG